MVARININNENNIKALDMNMLEIKDLHASVNGKEILKGINLTVKAVKYMPSWDQTVLVRAH
jgi:hypothetical protein